MPVSPALIALIILLYFVVVIAISRVTASRGDNKSFYLGDRKSPWFVVAYGMVGASLSGITFISVPGWVEDRQFAYMQMVLGYLLGYFVIIHVLLPLYYRLNLTSIYTYLKVRFGNTTYKSGASLFLVSRILGASARLYVVASVMQMAVFDSLHIPFFITVIVTLALIWVYTYRGGIKTIIWTDTLQTTFMLTAVALTVIMISRNNGWGLSGLFHAVADSEQSRIFFFDDFRKADFFVKQFFSGMFITIVMTGLDQDMMQKNLSCRNLKDAQKNMFWFSLVLVPVNLLFLSLGVLLYREAAVLNLHEIQGDKLFPYLAANGYLGASVAVFFIIGLIAAAYSSADSALTSLTTSFTIDILGRNPEDETGTSTRIKIHALMTLVLFGTILVINGLNETSIISTLFMLAGYTYGPLLGLYAYGLFTRRSLNNAWVPFISVLSPLVTHVVKLNAAKWLNGYRFDFEILILNGCITFIFLWLSSLRREKQCRV